MRTSINIARTELRTLFFSPIAWLVLVIFLFQCALSLTDIVSRKSADINAGMMAFNLTGDALAYFNGYFAAVQKTVFIYLPLLTMGLVSREISSGSIKLIFSSPVTARQLIAGKYIAMLVYCLLMALITVIAVIPAIVSIPLFDYGFLVGGVASTFLLVAAYAAIGLFMSCLTGYQVVAAISTMVLLGGLNYIGEVGKGTDVIRDVTGFLSVAGRGENLRDGLFTSGDLAYFIIVIVFFLSLGVQYLTAQQRPVTPASRFIKLTLLSGSLALFGFITSAPKLTWYADLSRTKQNTLPPEAQQALLAIKGPLKVTMYVNILDESLWSYGSPEKRHEDEEFWAPYVRFRPDMHFEYVYYYGKLNAPVFYLNNPGLTNRQIAEKKADAYGISMKDILAAERLPVKDLLKEEGNRTIRLIENNGKILPLRLFDTEMDANPSQQETTDAFSAFLEPQVQVAVLDGEAERGVTKEGDHDYKMPLMGVGSKMAMLNHGFAFRTIRADQPIPKDVELLIIADPRTPFSPEKQANLTAYIQSGRNLLIMGEPGKAAVINPLLDQLGLQLRPGILVERSKDFGPSYIHQKIQPTPGLGDAALEQAAGKDFTSTGVSALDLSKASDFRAFAILATDTVNTWYRESGTLPDTGQVVFNPNYGDQRGRVVTAYGLKRSLGGKREQRIIACADADFLTLAEFYRTGSFYYKTLMMRAMFRYLSNDRFPKNLTAVSPPDIKITANKESVFRFRIIFLGVLPGLLLLSGAILLIRRRGR